MNCHIDEAVEAINVPHAFAAELIPGIIVPLINEIIFDQAVNIPVECSIKKPIPVTMPPIIEIALPRMIRSGPIAATMARTVSTDRF